MSTSTRPADIIARLTAERSGHADGAILDELRALDALPDEQDPSWRHDQTWSRAYLLVALAGLVATRQLEGGVGLVLDKIVTVQAVGKLDHLDRL